MRELSAGAGLSISDGAGVASRYAIRTAISQNGPMPSALPFFVGVAREFYATPVSNP